MIFAIVVLAVVLTGVSGVPGLVLRKNVTGERLATILMVAGSAMGLAAALGVVGPLPAAFTRPWQVPAGALALRLDGLSAMFLAQIFAIAPLGAVYGSDYWSQRDHPADARKLRLFYGLLTAGMAVLVVADNAVLFLIGWETMALSAFMLVTTEDSVEAVRRAGYVYLAATRIGTLSLLAMFAVLHAAIGTWSFAVPPGGLAVGGPATAVFVLAIIGFGLKAGLMPFHVWLPDAHANAPSHVSAVMSGVLIKMGIYGLVRVCSFYEHPPIAWGAALLVLGVLSGVFGVAFAIGQHDLKRLLAYHSVENIGIITMGLGLAVLGRAAGAPEIAALGLAGALLHVWNHGLFKALLFLSAGSIVHATGTREIDRLGGLAKRMPRTALAFLVGAVAICGLPPLNGFVSEFLVYLGLLRAVGGERIWLWGALGASALALIGALAVACFVKVFGAAFLGQARSDRVSRAHESGLAMTAPMGVLAASCALIGLLPVAVRPVLDQAFVSWAPEMALARAPLAAAPLGLLSIAGASLLALLVAGSLALARLTRQARAVRAVTWDCGYAAPSARMQYTSSSFAESLVGLFAWALRPRVHARQRA